MKQITFTLALAAIAAAPLPAFAGRDQAQIIVLERAYERQAQQAQPQAQSQPSTQGRAAAGPAGQTAKEGAPADRQLELLKRFHPKRAYGG